MMFDNLNLKISEHFVVLVNEFNPNSVVMAGSGYGRKLTKPDKSKNHRWEIVGYLKAQYILTAQQKMMDFLRRTVECILRELPSSGTKVEVDGMSRCACSCKPIFHILANIFE